MGWGDSSGVNMEAGGAEEDDAAFLLGPAAADSWGDSATAVGSNRAT
jgi:hypothetical protein